MFGKDFYPTPHKVLDSLLLDVNNKIVLEPSAGKGNIVDYCINNQAKKILTYEIESNLASIISQKSVFMGNDFLKADPTHLSHIDIIIANPPFSDQLSHILKMWEVAPEGCQIVSLCNYSSLSQGYSSKHRQLDAILSTYGSLENIGKVFSDAERETNVITGVIRLNKPVISEDFNYEGFYFDAEPTPDKDGVIQYNEIKAMVSSYIYAVKKFDEFEVNCNQINNLIKTSYKVNITDRQNVTINRETFRNELQANYWQEIFKKLNVEKYVTQNVMEKLNKFIKTNEKYPFTMKNIYKMIEIIYGTRESTFKQGLIEVVNCFTRYTHENRYNVEGWKTNKGHLLNKKIIIPNACEISWNGKLQLKPYYNSNIISKVDDLIKILCHLTGTDYSTVPKSTHVTRELSRGQWHQWAFWNMKPFKKGTIHLEFINESDWIKLNKAYAEAIGYKLPEKL